MLVRAAVAGCLQVGDVGQNIDRSRSAFSMPDRMSTSHHWTQSRSCSSWRGNSPATPGLLVDREAAPDFAHSITESAGSARRAFELRTRTVIQSDGILHGPLLRERALCVWESTNECYGQLAIFCSMRSKNELLISVSTD